METEKEYTRNWVGSKPNQWLKHICPVLAGKPGLRYLEIGVFEGRSTVWVMENILTGPDCSAIGIDPFIYGRKRLSKNKNKDKIKQRALNNLKDYEFQLIVGTSQDVLRKMQDQTEHYDLIYVDGDHMALNAYVDAFLTWPLLKPGGFMVFDDYGLSLKHRTVLYTPKAAVDFFVENQEDCELLWTGKQAGVRKTEQEQ